MELPGNAGRYVLVTLGSVIVAAALGLRLSRPSLLADGLLVFGVVLVLLGFVQHLLMKRDRAHWPDQALLWADGIELVLHNGEIRAASWTDPELSFDIYVRPLRRSTSEEILLVWKSDRRIPPCHLTSEGLERIRVMAAAHGLTVLEFRDSGRKHAMRAYEVRAPPPDENVVRSSGGTSPSPP